MKTILCKIIITICLFISINACHTFEHNNIFIENKESTNQKNSNDENIKSKIKKKDVNNRKPTEINEMAPIDIPKKKEKVQKQILKKKTLVNKNFNLKKLKNWTEVELIKTLGKGDFIKEEGKLKNYQYYFNECFLDVFVLKVGSQRFVNYIETRPTKLNGKINVDACLKEINKILN